MRFAQWLEKKTRDIFGVIPVSQMYDGLIEASVVHSNWNKMDDSANTLL